MAKNILKYLNELKVLSIFVYFSSPLSSISISSIPCAVCDPSVLPHGLNAPPPMRGGDPTPPSEVRLCLSNLGRFSPAPDAAAAVRSVGPAPGIRGLAVYDEFPD